jgi:iron complex outermembrane receptor protein
MKKLMLLLLASWLSGQVYAQSTLSGKVIDETGEPLVGATVILKGTTLGNPTNLNGMYSISRVPNGNYILSVTFVGYKTQEKTIRVDGDLVVDFSLEESAIMADEVVVLSTRANEKTPTTYSTLDKEEISSRNLGQDVPILLNFAPSVVTTSDAGAGIGYTGMRIRGSDQTRINVTINGIPVNDSESHGVFWVDLPDVGSSMNSIQIQRGVGTSSNGAGAFGATVNLQTNNVSPEPFVQTDNTIGSFNTWKSNLTVNTGLIKDLYNFEARLSKIQSDGYLDRSASDLKSYYLSGGRYGEKTMIKFITFGGKEVTQQAWYGTPEAVLTGNEDDLNMVLWFSGEYDTQEQIDNLFNSDRKFNYYLYDNQVDDYQQDHFQLHVGHTFSDELSFSGALHYTRGKGYYEQFRNDDGFDDYNLPNLVIGDSTITSTDLIRRRWLDNHFYGATYSFLYNKNNLALTLGGAYNEYDGDHFGEIIWARFAGNTNIRDRYYDGTGVKKDFNSYLKINYQLSDKLNLFGDGQVRTIRYETAGVDSDLQDYDVNRRFNFFNPKVGLTYSIKNNLSLYGSYAIAHREPVRSDFLDAPNGTKPTPETLRNLEVGVRSQSSKWSYQANYFLMSYQDQLVLTGQLNDVGASVRQNVPDSYRMGVELVSTLALTDQLVWSANLSLSENKIQEFTEVVYDYGANFDDFRVVEIEHQNTDISFSPNVVAGSDLTYSTNGFSASLLTKYVGKQYLDNTSNNDRSIDAYLTNDIRLAYNFNIGSIENIGLTLLVNNVLNEEYSSNGYTWGYYYGADLYQQNNYYPQAGRHFLAGVSVKF